MCAGNNLGSGYPKKVLFSSRANIHKPPLLLYTFLFWPPREIVAGFVIFSVKQFILVGASSLC